MKFRLRRRYEFKPGDRVETWSPLLDGYRGTLVRKSRIPWTWVVEFDSDDVPGGKRQTMGQGNLVPERLAPDPGIDDLLYRHLRRRR